MGARTTVTDVLVDVTKPGCRRRWQSVKARWPRRSRSGAGVRIEIDISNVRGGAATIEQAFRRLADSRVIAMSTIGMWSEDTVSTKVICTPDYGVIQAILSARNVDHPFVVAICTKLREELDSIGKTA